MPEIDWIPLISYILITTLTPGPNNITGASMGVLHGYRKTLPYVLGVAAGNLVIMTTSGLLSGALLVLIPQLEVALRIIGAAYILWLAYEAFRATYSFEVSGQPPLGFLNGLILQFLNPKVLIYALTLFSTFLQPVTGRIVHILLSAAVLACMAFIATSTWSAAGSVIRSSLERPAVRKTVNLVLSLLLVYTAIEISGVLDMIKG